MITIPKSELRQLRMRVRLLKEMATHINSGLELKQLVERTLLEAHKDLPDFRISFCTLDDEGKLKVFSSVSPMNMPVIDGRQYALGETAALAQLLQSGKPIAIPDLEADEHMAPFREAARRADTRAALIMPIRHPQQVLAAILFATSQPHEWTPYEVEILTDIAEHLGISIRQAFLQQERERADSQLRESQKMEAVGRLVGGVAHDFNNLLTGMMIYSGLLATALGEGNPLLRHVREIQNAGERGASLVGQLLSLSRNQVLEPRLLSLSDVVGAMREMLQRVVGEEVLIECHLAGDLSFSRIDENQLRQAVLNLAINARDAMKGGGRLTLTTANVTVDRRHSERVPGLTPGDYTVLSVKDTGTGMSAETLTHCFEPFFTTKPTGEGTGLGLAAVYGMARQHGGHVAVQSALGEGTNFDLYFPVAEATTAEPARPESGRPRRTVLLVEDEDLLRLPLTEQLKAEGYHVLSAPGPLGALESARRFGGVIDLLVTDLVMPGMTGTELARRLDAERPEMRVLYMSGYTNDERARRLISSGAEFLRKPFNADVFTRRVHELLDRESVVLGGHHPRQQKSISILGKET